MENAGTQMDKEKQQSNSPMKLYKDAKNSTPYEEMKPWKLGRPSDPRERDLPL